MARKLGSTVSNRAVNNEMVKLARDCQSAVNGAILDALKNNWLVIAIIDDYTTVHSKHRPTNTKASTSIPMCTIVCRIFPSIQAVPNQSVEILHCSLGIDIESLINELTNIPSMHAFGKSFAENMPDWIRDIFFDPELVRHRLDTHSYHHSSDV